MSYQDVKKRGALIAAVTQTRYMPPWHAAPGYGDFIDVHRLTDDQIASIKQWVDAGMPEGDPAKLPAIPKFPKDGNWVSRIWCSRCPRPSTACSGPGHLSQLHHSAEAARKQVGESRGVPAERAQSGASRAVFPDSTGESASTTARAARLDTTAGSTARASPSPGGWAAGPSAAIHISCRWAGASAAKNSDFVMQIHFHLTGKAEKEQSTIGLYSPIKAPERMITGVQVPAVFGVGHGTRYPGGREGLHH